MLCNICPRRCGAERTETRGGGVCAMPAGIVAAKAMLHQWEEPVLSGTNGAGCVFFSGCNLGCVFCQNGKISHENFGKVLSPARLRDIFFELIAQGAHCIDLVSPTHFTPWVLEALEDPLPVPVVWNSGGYERVETLKTLEGRVQIYLPDLKYALEKPARELSCAGDYFPVAAAAIDEMKKRGCKHIKLMVLVAAPEGIEHIQKLYPDVEIYAGALDDHLNEHGYIVPGLGDAGDRIYGTK